MEAAPSLENLPFEILLEIVSWLDWGSLRSLGRASRYCRDAVTGHLGRLRVFHVWLPDVDGVVRTSADLTLLLSQMTSLRQLYVEPCGKYEVVLEALLACSWSWPFLQRLSLDIDEYPVEPLERLCAGCENLTEVTLCIAAGDEAVEAVLAGRPDLLALHVGSGSPDYGLRSRSLRGDFFARLPPKLRRLGVRCSDLRSSAVTELAHCGELRSLELSDVYALRQEDLATGLAGCVRLERLRLATRDESVGDCLPPAGLPALRWLELSDCQLLDSDLQQLVLRLPNLQSVCLHKCFGSTQRGLARLGRLPALTSLELIDTEGVSDWALAQLSATRLAELRLEGASAACVTADDLLRLSHTCPSLENIVAVPNINRHMETESAKCGPGTDEGHLLEWLERLPEK